MPNAPLANSTYLDFTSHGMTTATSVDGAYGFSDPTTPSSETINVALVLPRANDPTPLLNGNWATRQKALTALNDNHTLWSTYGAEASDYNTIISGLEAMDIPVIGDANGASGYVTSAASRTIWVTLTPENFEVLFGTKPFQGPPANPIYYWKGSLSLPDTWNIDGLWFDTSPIYGTFPATSDLSEGAVATLDQGPQSIGNQLLGLNKNSINYARDIADWFYNFPLSGLDVKTTTIGLVEPGIGDAIPDGSKYTFQDGLDSFRARAGTPTFGYYYNVANGGQSYTQANNGERSLDVGVIASATPQSRIGLYAGSGFDGVANANAYTSYQAAFWDLANNPPVVSSSFGIFQQASPNSPFARAVRELFVDSALRNISTFVANNDFGSSYEFSNGLANQNPTLSSPYAVLVGGTSLTTVSAAPQDPTLTEKPTAPKSLYELALAGDLPLLWQLIAGGLTTLPSDAAAGPAAAKTTLVETVWNNYVLSGSRFNQKEGLASDGGVDTTQPTPSYQSAFGLTPTSANPGAATGRGAPDVSALAGSNMLYYGPPPSMGPLTGNEYYEYLGTSASSPLWASLMSQVDTIFEDQRLPQLGYMNDLLYTAAAVAPASFNDITLGNNTTSYIYGGPIKAGGYDITLTGYGYEAGPGYDLTTGLGTPNGVLLARALAAVAHAQVSFADTPVTLEPDGSGGWRSPVAQSLLFQTTLSSAEQVDINAGDRHEAFDGQASAPYAWAGRMAGQSLQAGFDPKLVTMFDKQSQGTLLQQNVAAGDEVSVAIDAVTVLAAPGSLTSPFGFVDFVSSASGSTVRIARPVAVAQTVGGSDDQTAVVRLVQNGLTTPSLMFYRVDDFSGTINGLAPGSAGYAAAAAARAYTTGSGETSVTGPGYGSPASQTTLTHVNANDLIAMELSSGGHEYWAFSQANEKVDGSSVGHLWNYGLNTWGWEDNYGGGDRDYNDLIVQLDFTSTAGHGWLA